MRRRIAALLAVALGAVTLVGAPVAANAAPEAPAIVINEVDSDPNDWVELYNPGDVEVDASGWVIKDDKSSSTLGQGTVVPAHGYLVLQNGTDFSFGLGNGDEVHVFRADGTTLVDEMSYATHAATTWGRCPDLTGPFLTTLEATPGAANACDADPATAVKINEVESSNGTPGDWIELKNTALVPVEAGGLVLRDNDDTHTFTIPNGTTIEGGGYAAFDVESAFGLGGADSARLFTVDGATLIDSYAWTAHAGTTYGRCADGTGPFVETAAPTKGAANECPLPDGAGNVTINEVENDGGDPGDWVELYNSGTTDVDISSWYIGDDSKKEQLKPGTVVPAGGFRVLDTKVDFGFGLGKDADEVHLFLADGVTVVDEMGYSTLSPTTLGRCPDGVGAFVVTAAATKGAANACVVDPADALVINEVDADAPDKGSDWVELLNTTTAPVDAGGLKLKDSGEGNTITIPADSVVPAHGYFAIDVTGLGASGDSARLFSADETMLIDSTAWTATADETWGRCPDGIGAFADTEGATRGAANNCPPPAGYQDVVINEVESNGDVHDWVELYNRGETPVDLSAWIVRDNKDEDAVRFAPGTTIAPHGFAVIETDVDGGFGLGNPDQARVFLPDGVTLVDQWDWEGHAKTTYGLCPDGTGDYVTTFQSTRGAPNDCSPVRINEIESDDPAKGSDWVELMNAGTSTADLSGYVIKDDDDAHAYTIPGGTTLAPGAFQAFDVSSSFGLGGADSVRLYTPGGTTLLASFTWTTHAATTWARCPDGTGVFGTSASATKGAANDCGQLTVESWPGAETVSGVDGYAFGGDMSGLVYESTAAGERGILWAVNNGTGTLYKLVWNGAAWAPAGDEWANGKKLTYPDGTGTVDAEGVTIRNGSSAGGVYVSSERNNAANGVSRPSVLRYDVSAPGTTLVATHEWNLAGEALAGIGANQGLEGIAWIPDATLLARGFLDERTHGLYDPAAYPDHGDGVFFVGVEGTKKVYAVVLQGDGTWNIVATLDPGLGNVAEVAYDAATGVLWAICDEACNGETVTFEIASDGAFAGSFRLTHAYANPVGMVDTIANEGFAFGSADLCVDGLKPVFYADDAQTAGIALRESRITCPNLDPGDPGEPGQPGGSDGPGDLPTTGGTPVPPSEDRLNDQTRDRITTPATTVEQGATVTITVGAQHAGETVDGWIFSTPTHLGTAVVDASGRVTFTIPSSLPAGPHRLVVTDESGAVIGWTSITVAAAGSLAATGGSSSFPLVAAAGALLFTGAALFVVARRRRAA